MKKKTGKFLKSLIVILGAAIISVVMCGCSSATTEEKLVGAWKKENSSETFLWVGLSGGTFILRSKPNKGTQLTAYWES